MYMLTLLFWGPESQSRLARLGLPTFTPQASCSPHPVKGFGHLHHSAAVSVSTFFSVGFFPCSGHSSRHRSITFFDITFFITFESFLLSTHASPQTFSQAFQERTISGLVLISSDSPSLGVAESFNTISCSSSA